MSLAGLIADSMGPEVKVRWNIPLLKVSHTRALAAYRGLGVDIPESVFGRNLLAAESAIAGEVRDRGLLRAQKAMSRGNMCHEKLPSLEDVLSVHRKRWEDQSSAPRSIALETLQALRPGWKKGSWR